MALFTAEDLATVAETLPEKTAALVVLFEHRWAVDIKEAIAAKGGLLIGRSVIPPEVLEEPRRRARGLCCAAEAAVA